MNREELITAVKEQMPERRWQHTLGVMETSVILANRFGGRPCQSRSWRPFYTIIASIGPFRNKLRLSARHGLPQDLLDYDKELWHSHAGAYIAKEQFGINDEDVLDAIRYHTSGRVQMTLMDKIGLLGGLYGART